jgi:hypothetical protein
MTVWHHVQMANKEVVLTEEGVGVALAKAEMDVPDHDLDAFKEQYGEDWDITVLAVCPPSCTAQLAKEA